MAITQGTWGSLLGPISNIDLGLTERFAPWLGNNPNQQTNAQVLSSQTEQQQQQPTLQFGNAPLVTDFAKKTTVNNPVNNNPPTNNPPAGPSGPSQEELHRQQMEGLIGQNEQDLLGGLTPSYQNQLNMANQWGQQSKSDLNTNVQSNIGDLTKQIGTTEQNQVKSLKDVADNIRNLMQAGNTYLGARGAGDSSAVNQYAYGLTKLGSQQRGDVMAQTKNEISKINDNIAKVNLVATQEKQKIDYEVGQKTQEIAQWFADQQTQIKSAANKDKQALATNLYNQAVSALSQLQNYAQSRQAQIQSWALSNSTSAKEAIQKMQQYGSYQAAAPVYNPIAGGITTDAGGNMTSAFRGGGTGGLTNLSEEQKRLLGIA